MFPMDAVVCFRAIQNLYVLETVTIKKLNYYFALTMEKLFNFER